MEMHQIRYTLAIVDNKGFTRAAAACHVSQPALTKAIKKFEDELESPLFVRASTGVTLTEFGRILLPKLRAIAARDSDVKEMARNIKRLRMIPVRIGVLNTVGARKISNYVQRFLTAAAEAEIECYIHSHSKLLTMLEEGRIDLMISNFALATSRTGDSKTSGQPKKDLPPWCVVKELYDEPYVIALPPNHVLAQVDSTADQAVSISDFIGEAHVDRIACEMRDKLSQVLNEKDVNFYPAIRTDRENWVESLVSEGIGFAIMPKYSIQNPATKTVTCSDVDIQRTISIARSADLTATPVAKKLWDVIRESS